jgi:hypothetical protein
MALRNSKGRVALLRVNERKGSFGKSPDSIVAEVILQLEGVASRSFGFRLLDDDDLPVRRAYLDLLRDALNHGHVVHIDYEIAAGKTKGEIVRVWLTPAPRTGPGLVPRFKLADVGKLGEG